MTVYRYGLRMRPPMPGAIPKYGLVACHDIEGMSPSGHYIYGLVDYKDRLTVGEVEAYELKYMGKVEEEDRKQKAMRQSIPADPASGTDDV